MLLAVVMVFALCACSNGGDNGGTDAKDDGKVNLDFVTRRRAGHLLRIRHRSGTAGLRQDLDQRHRSVQQRLAGKR